MIFTFVEVYVFLESHMQIVVALLQLNEKRKKQCRIGNKSIFKERCSQPVWDFRNLSENDRKKKTKKKSNASANLCLITPKVSAWIQ